MNLNLITNIEFEGIDSKDSPDFCDAFISYAEYDGEEMTEEQLEEINSYEHNDFKYEKLMDFIY